MYRTFQWPLLFLTFLAAGLLRFHALDRQSLWDDELSTVRTATNPPPEWRHRFETYEAHPPLYFLQLRAWMALGGKSLVAVRADSAFWGTLAVLLIFFLGESYGGFAVGFLAMLLLAISPLHLAYSQEARPYALGMCLGIAALLVYEKRVRRGAPQAEGVVTLGLLWTALLYTHYWGSFVVLAQGLYAYWKAPTAESRRTVVMAFAGACLIFSLWVPILLSQMQAIGELSFWMPFFSVGQLFKPLAAFSGLFFNVASYVFYLPTKLWLLLSFGSAFAIALIAGMLKGARGPLVWLSVGLVLPWIISYWNHGIFLWYRYPTLIFPAFVLLVAMGVLSWTPKWAGLLAGVLLLSQAWGCWFYFHGWQKANPKAVVQYVHWLEQRDSVVIRPAYFADLFSFYDGHASVTIDQHTLDSPEKRAALRGHHLILIAFQVPSDPISQALLTEFHPISARYFAGYAHLGITVYQLR